MVLSSPQILKDGTSTPKPRLVHPFITFLPTVPGGGTVGLFLLLLLLLLHTTNFGGWVGLYCTVLCTVL